MEESQKHATISPVRLFLITTALVFFIVVLLIFIFFRLPQIPHAWDEVVDGAVLTILLSPALYILLVRPLTEQIKRREEAEKLLQSMHNELEIRVADRTAELALANALLEEEVEYHTQVRDALEHERNILESRVEERTLELRHEVIHNQEVAERLRLQTTALESAANGVIITDRQGAIEWANQAFLTMTGYTAQEVLGRSPRMMKSGLYGKQFYSSFWKTILSGQVWQGELTNRRKDGSLYIEEQTVTPVPDDSGKITHFIAIKQDITDRKSAEEVIRADSARTKMRAGIEEALSNATPDFQTVLDVTVQRMADLIGDMCLIHLKDEPDGSVVPAAFHQSGPYQETPLAEELASIARGQGADLARMVLETGQPFTYPSMTINRVAADLVNEMRATLDISSILVIPLNTQGRHIGALSLYRRCANPPYISGDQTIVEDLAERVALAIAHARLYQDLETALKQEQDMRAQLVQTEKFAAIGRMVASVAHELNNPLQTIKNCLYLIEPDVTDSSAQEFLGLASKEIQRLSELVDQLREVYRPRSTTQMMPFDLGRLLEDVHLLMIPHLQNNRVRWEMVPPASPVTVNGIPDQIKQVFLNISLNAIEAMQPQGGIIHISLDLASDENRVGITFHDTGPGISNEHIAHVFEPLYTTKENGLGLGLSISYDVVQKHAGQIIVESPPGQGTIFTVWLPQAPVDSSQLQEEELVG